MPGAITNPGLNPFQSYLEFNNGSPTAEQDYQSGLSKGYQWTGAGWKFGGGTDQSGWTEAMKKGAAAGTDASRWGGGGAPMSGASPGVGAGDGFGGAGSSSSFMSGSSFGGHNPFATDAAAAKLRDEFARLKKSGASAMNEDLSARGIFSSGVGARLSNDQQTQYGLQEAAALEDLYNRSAQQQMAFDLEQKRAAAGMYGGGGQRFDSANTGGNTNQQLMNYYSSKGSGQQGGGGGGFGGGTMIADPANPSGGGGAAAPSRRDSSSAFYKTYGKWPSPAELDAFMSGSMGAYNPDTDQSMALPGTSVFG